MTKIKICGLKRLIDAEYVNEVMPEYAGFVFWDRSSRNVTYDEAKSIREHIDEQIQSVGVFVDADIDFIAKLVTDNIISCVQLHGKESDEYILKLRNIIGSRAMIIKAYEVKDASDIDRANNSIADMILVDSGKGSGNAFDWSVLKDIKREYFLAGGLSQDNVSAAIDMLRPYAVDVSSKVETDGCKDIEKIRKFCGAVRSQNGGNDGIKG